MAVKKHKHKVLLLVIFGTGGMLAAYYHIFAAEDIPGFRDENGIGVEKWYRKEYRDSGIRT